VQIPDPTPDTDVVTWANQVCYALTNYVNISPLTEANDWQTWGMLFLNSPTLTVLSPPNPYWFPENNWVLWGQQLADTLNNATGSSGSSNGGGIVPGGGAALLTQLGAWILTQQSAPIQTQN
jgi:hypothetical protein